MTGKKKLDFARINLKKFVDNNKDIINAAPMLNGRAGRAFLQALRVTRACVLSFPLCIPPSRVLFQSFFFTYQDSHSRAPAFSHSKFCNAFQFRMLKKTTLGRLQH